MSRKTNRLRTRYRMASEMAYAAKRRLDKTEQALAYERKRAAELDRNTFARSIMLRVEQERHLGDTYAAQVHFHPDSYLRFGQMSRDPVNLTAMAHEIGGRIGAMVTRAILDRLSAQNRPAGSAGINSNGGSPVRAGMHKEATK